MLIVAQTDESDAWDLSLVSNLSFMILVSPRFQKNDVKAAGPKISWRVTNCKIATMNTIYVMPLV
jgi:hypothetical protein